MRTTPALIASLALGALVLTSGCTTTEQTSPPAATTSAATTSAVPTTAAPTTSEPAEAAATTADSTASGEAAGAAGDAPAGIPTDLVEPEAAWSTQGQLIAVLGETVVVRVDTGTGTQLVGHAADGSTSWTHQLTVPDGIDTRGDSPSLRPFYLAGLDTLFVARSGPSTTETGRTALVVQSLDPATGQIVATDSLTTEGHAFDAAVSLDELRLSPLPETGASHAVLAVDERDGSVELTDDRGMGQTGALSVTRTLGVLLEGGHVSLVDAAGDPARDGAGADGADCPDAVDPGWPYAYLTSPDGGLVAVPGAVVELGTGAVTCTAAGSDAGIVSEIRALGDDGTYLAVAGPDGERHLVLVTPDGTVTRNGAPVTTGDDGRGVATPAAILGDLVIFSADDAADTRGTVYAYRLR